MNTRTYNSSEYNFEAFKNISTYCKTHNFGMTFLANNLEYNSRNFLSQLYIGWTIIHLQEILESSLLLN